MAAPITFSNQADYDARPRTTAEVVWGPIAHWTADVRYQSPDISAIIQELVNSYAISACVLFWDDYDDLSTHAAGCNRAGYDHNQSPAQAPELEITYTSPTGTRRRTIFLRGN